MSSRGHDDLQRHLAGAETILCAGAVGSPQLLNLSGIGNAPDLEALGIKAQHHLPEVGQNLQDHLGLQWGKIRGQYLGDFLVCSWCFNNIVWYFLGLNDSKIGN